VLLDEFDHRRDRGQEKNRSRQAFHQGGQGKGQAGEAENGRREKKEAEVEQTLGDGRGRGCGKDADFQPTVEETIGGHEESELEHHDRPVGGTVMGGMPVMAKEAAGTITASGPAAR